MPSYKVLVSHNGWRSKSVVEFEASRQVDYLVEAGYLRPLEVKTVEDLGQSVVLVPGAGGDDHVPSGRKRQRKTQATPEVNDGPDSPEPGGSSPDGEEAGV